MALVDEAEWTVEAPLDPPRLGHTAVAHGSKVYVIGGREGCEHRENSLTVISKVVTIYLDFVMTVTFTIQAQAGTSAW